MRPLQDVEVAVFGRRITDVVIALKWDALCLGPLQNVQVASASSRPADAVGGTAVRMRPLDDVKMAVARSLAAGIVAGRCSRRRVQAQPLS